MTPNQRQRHLVALKKVLTDAGFRQDSYGNFKYPECTSYRFKFKKVNYRIESHMPGRWVNIESKVWSQIDIDYFVKCVASIKKRVLRDLGPKKVTKTSKGVPLAPALDNPAKVKQMETILEKRNHQDYQCYMILQEMRDAGLLMSTREPIPADMQDAADISLRAQTAISNRVDLNDKFMRLMAGVE